MSKVNIVNAPESAPIFFDDLEYNTVYLDDDGDVCIKVNPVDHDGKDVILLFSHSGTIYCNQYESEDLWGTLGRPVKVIPLENITVKIP